MNTVGSRVFHFGCLQGTGEERLETYKGYDEAAPQSSDVADAKKRPQRACFAELGDRDG